MKSISKIFGLLMMVAVAFSACSSDDDGPAAVPVNKIISHTYSIPVQGVENQEQKEVKTTLELKDAVGEEIAKNLISAEHQRGASPLMIRGLKAVSETGKIKNFTIKVGNRSAVNLGTCTANPGANEFQSDVVLGDDKYTEITKYILEDMKSRKKVDIYLTFTSDVTLTAGTTPVFLDITVTGNYRYNTYPTK